jgi:hypothetical protein
MPYQQVARRLGLTNARFNGTDCRRSHHAERRARIGLITCLMLLSTDSSLTLASDATAPTPRNNAEWIASLLKTNSGKAFCPPPGTTVGTAVHAMSDYMHSHKLPDRLNDAEALGIFGELYPCAAPVAVSIVNPSDPLSSHGGQTTTVVPQGQYASIDTRPTLALTRALYATTGHENGDLIHDITQNPGAFDPPILFALASVLFRQGSTDDAVFWLNAARIRAEFDAQRCTDLSARSAVGDLVRQMPRELIIAQFRDRVALKKTIDRAIAWDDATPYRYDYRWINLHGLRAIQSGLGGAPPTEPMTVPREQWASISQTVHTEIRDGLLKAFDQVEAASRSPQEKALTAR